MEESISGFKTRGDWGDVVEHGERITRALREVGVTDDSHDASEDEADGATDADTEPNDGADGTTDADTAGEPGTDSEPGIDSEPGTDSEPGIGSEPGTDDAAETETDDGDGETDYADAFDEWDEWRPKAHERLSEDVEEKTAEQASVAEGEGEKAGEKPGDDLRTAGEKLSESYEQVEAGDDEGALKRWQDSIDHVVRAADSAGRQAVRSVEDTVYRRVMTQLAPYYFDNELVSANIQKTTRGEEDGPAFVFEVNVNDDAIKQAVSDRLAEYEDEVDRWHVDTQKAVESVEAAEGVEPPADTVDNDDGTSGRSRSTTN